MNLFKTNKNLIEQSADVVSVFTESLNKLDIIEEQIIAKCDDLYAQADALKAEAKALTEQKKTNWEVKKNLKAILGK